MSFLGIFWKAEIYINSENKKKKETGVIKMIRTKLSRTLKESPFELYSLQINREISTKIFSHIPFEPKKIYDPACRYGNMLQYFNQMYCDKPMFGQDFSPYKIKTAKRSLDNFTGYVGDPIKDDFFKFEKFDCIVTSLPLELRSEKVRPDIYDERFKQFDFEKLYKLNKSLIGKDYNDEYNYMYLSISYEYSYLLHILHHLEDDGVALVVCSTDVLHNVYEVSPSDRMFLINYNGKIEKIKGYSPLDISDFNDHEIKKWMFENGYIDTIIKLPEININDIIIDYCILILRKNRDNSKVIYIEDLDGNREELSVNEIERNDYCI